MLRKWRSPHSGNLGHMPHARKLILDELENRHPPDERLSRPTPAPKPLSPRLGAREVGSCSRHRRARRHDVR